MSCFESLRGFLPSSMLDWPGKICTVVFLAGCNFRCPYCHNPELVEAGEGAAELAWEDLAFYLRSRSGWVDGVSITGGEPTIHADLPLLCERLREMGMLVKVDTNGSRPRLLRGVLERGLADFVAMDLKTSLEKYPLVARRPVDPGWIEESIGVVMASGVEHEFRCTVVPGLVGLEDLASLAELVEGGRKLVLQQFHSENTLDPGYAGARGYPEEVLLEWAEKLSRRVPTQVRGLLETSRR